MEINFLEFCCRCILDKSTSMGHCNNVKSLSVYERTLSLLYNNYVRAEVEFVYQIDQLMSRVRSMEKSRDAFNFVVLRGDYDRDMDVVKQFYSVEFVLTSVLTPVSSTYVFCRVFNFRGPPTISRLLCNSILTTRPVLIGEKRMHFTVATHSTCNLIMVSTSPRIHILSHRT